MSLQSALDVADVSARAMALDYYEEGCLAPELRDHAGCPAND